MAKKASGKANNTGTGTGTGTGTSARVYPELSVREESALKEEARKRCTDDLHYLAKEVLGYNRITDHYHKRMAMDIDTPKYKFKLLLHPRGHFKSTIGTESRSIQKLLRNPNERILITNAKLENARRFLRAIAHHWNANPKFRWLWRDYWIEQYSSPFMRAELGDKLDWVMRDTQDEFTLLRPYVGREASITTGSTEASLVSQHYSTILADDLINREFVRTVGMIERSVLYFKDLLDLLDPDGELEIIGTRWSHVDLYSWIIEEFGGVASLRVPENYLDQAVVETAQATPEEAKSWMISIQPCYDTNGEPVFPEEFNRRVLKQLEDAKGPYEFGAQYLLNPTPKEHQRFREEWFNDLDLNSLDTSRMQICITVDPAKSLEDRADNTAMVVCGYDDHNRMYFLDGRDEKLGVEDLPEALFDLVRHWQRQGGFLLPVGFEAVGFQETYVYNLERKMLEENVFFAIEPIKRRSQSKEERILRLVPRIKNGFYAPRRMLKEPYRGGVEYDLMLRLKWQLLNFPFAGHDDVADALADQLDIVKAHRLPGEKPPPQDEKVVDFVHASIRQDKGRRQKPKVYNDAVR